jgi:hypothetical protein
MLKTRYENIVKDGEIDSEEALRIGEMVLDIEEFIEENELYYRIEELYDMLTVLEFEMDYL